MDSIKISFSVVCPLFLLMALGYLMRRIGWWDEPFLLKLNQISFRVFFFAYLFISVYNVDITQAFNPKLMGYALVGVLLAFLFATLQALVCSKDNRKRGVIAQGIARSNTLLFGMPVVLTLCGAEHAGEMAIVIAAIVPIYNVLSIILLETFGGSAISVKRILVQVVTNPLLIGAACGLVLMLFQWRLPAEVEKVVNDLSKLATPLALMVLGGTFNFKTLGGNWKILAWVCFSKLILMPVIFVGGGILIGLRDVQLAVLLAVFATPVAASSFTMAEQMNGDYELAGQIMVVSTAFSTLTMFGWIFILLQSGLI